MNRFIIIAFILALTCAPRLRSQELNCQVEINSTQVQGTNKSVFETLQQAISDYMNTTQFSSAQFAPNEKVECKLFFTIKSQDGDKLSGDLQVQSTRPVYNSSYTTTLLNFRDTKIDFEYREGEPLIFNLTTMENNLTQLLNYYAYLILAVDFDSFSPRGGQPFWDILATIVQQAQSSGETGWKTFEDNRNRSALLNVFTDQSTQGVRDMLYQYHLQGLDQMALSPDKGRAAITQSLDAISKLYSAQPMSVGISLFKDAKLDELVNIYSEAPQDERTKVSDLLAPIYPAEGQRIQQIRNGKNK